MKTRILFFVSAVIIAISFSSCMQTMRAEKRHYRSGFYIRNWHRTDQLQQRTDTSATVEVQETVFIAEPPGDSAGVQTALPEHSHEEVQLAELPPQQIDEHQPRVQRDSVSFIPPAEQKQKFPLHYNGPAVARP